MTSAQLFVTTFSAIMFAGLLLAIMLWGVVAYSRHEKAGTAGSRESRGPLAAILLPLAFLALTMMAAFDKVPAWLDAILK